MKTRIQPMTNPVETQPNAVPALMKLFSRTKGHFPWAGVVALILFLGAALPVAWGQDDVAALRAQAQTYFEADEARKAVATLLEAAQRDLRDRVTGAMLYSAIRDHSWHQPQILPVPHGAPVTALAFSPDGTKLASGSAEGLVLISSSEPLDKDDADAARVSLKHDSEIVGLVFSADGKRLAVAMRSGPVQVWDVATAKSLFIAPKAAGNVTAFAAITALNLTAIGTEGGAIQVLDIAAGKVVAEPQPPAGSVRALAFSRHGAKLAACADRTARVWDVASGRTLGGDIVREAVIRSVDFSSDERYVLVAGEDKAAWLLDPEAGIPVMPAMPCEAVVKKAVVSPCGSMIATLLDDSSVLLWDALTGKRLGVALREDGQMNDFIWSRASLRAATVSESGFATLWNTRDGTRRGETMPHGGPVLTAAVSPDFKLLATGSADGFARIWRTDGGLPLPTVRSHAARARSAFYSLDGEHLITASEDHTALHWISGHVYPFGPALKHKGKVTCAVFNQDATQILTCDDSGSAQLWDAETGKANGAPFRHSAAVNWVDFHPDGKSCVTASGAVATVWSVANRQKPLATIRHPGRGKSEIKCARFSPDGRWLATASTDGTARIWDAKTYRPVGQPIERGFPVLCVRFSPDGSRLVVAGEDAQAAVYDTATWQQVGVPVLMPGPVFSAAITEDNLFLVISSLLLDAVQFFEIASGRPLGNGVAIPSQATCVDYNLPDRVVVVACDDGTVRAIEAPFVTQDVPAWVIGFMERLIGLRKTGPETFERVDSHAGELRSYATAAARALNADFARLVRWKMSPGVNRNGMPRFTSTVAANIERRVEERSVDALFECYQSVSVDPLILAALSLYLPNARQGEYLADLVLSMKEVPPLARCYAAGTLIRAGRSQEAEPIMAQAVADAPQDPLVLRRAAKMHARLYHLNQTVALFEQAIALDPDNAETHRSYGWALYNLDRPSAAAAQFHLAEEIGGEMIEDLIAGLCLCAAEQRKTAEAKSSFARLVALDPDWKKREHLASLRGWTAREVGALERVRQTIFPAK